MAERLLILGGTAEAATLAQRAGEAFAGVLEVTTSLAGRTASPRPLPGRVRIGGFGGSDGLAACLARERFDLLIDATHPFAAAISRHAADACTQADVPRLMLIRPPWTPQPGDCWHAADTLDDAAAMLPGLGKRIFLATGSGSIAAFAPLTELWFLVRMMTPPTRPLPLARHRLLIARPPFHRADEAAVFSDHRIEVVVSKNSGGSADAKLAAARDLGLPVVMIRRPRPPPGEQANSVAAAMEWLRARVVARRSPSTPREIR